MTTMAAAAVPQAQRRAVPHRAAPLAKRAAVTAATLAARAAAKRVTPRPAARLWAEPLARPERAVAWAAPITLELAGAMQELAEWAQVASPGSSMLAARPTY